MQAKRGKINKIFFKVPLLEKLRAVKHSRLHHIRILDKADPDLDPHLQKKETL